MKNTVVETLSPQAAEMKKIIIDRIDAIDRTKVDLKNAREMLTAAFVNTEEYRTAKSAEGTEKRKREAIENKVMLANPKLADKVDELKEELKEGKDALSDYLAEFVRISGKTELDHPDGRRLSIVKRFKISPGQQRMDL